MTTYIIAIWDGTSVYQVCFSGISLAHALARHLSLHRKITFNTRSEFETAESAIAWLDAGVQRANTAKVRARQQTPDESIVPTMSMPLVNVASVTSEVTHASYSLTGMFGLVGA